jgi:HPt (histidine-containing phosphotransfer) domain-containing protein
VTDQESPLDARTLDELRANVGDDPAFVAELIEEFIEEAPRQLQVLREAATTGEAEAVRRAAHTLKGNARMFGAEGLASLCLEAETAAAAGDLDTVRQRLESVEAEWNRVREALVAARDR